MDQKPVLAQSVVYQFYFVFLQDHLSCAKMFRKTPFLHKNVSKVAQDTSDLDNIDKDK
jgi:hypothetical protein